MYSAFLKRSHYSTALLRRRLEAVGRWQNTLGIGLRRRPPSAYRGVGPARDAVGVGVAVGVATVPMAGVGPRRRQAGPTTTPNGRLTALTCYADGTTVGIVATWLLCSCPAGTPCIIWADGTAVGIVSMLCRGLYPRRRPDTKDQMVTPAPTVLTSAIFYLFCFQLIIPANDHTMQ
jgi:hypothetical protein